MSGSRHTCVMCGAVNIKRTLQHVLKDEWRKKYPWMNLPETSMSRTSFGVTTKEQRKGEFLNQKVGPFCGPCNNVFMESIERAAGNALHRLFTTYTLEIPADDIEPIRRWVYMTSLVRSLQDRAAGMAVPSEWFREFHATGGQVPENTSIIVARVNSPATLRRSRPCIERTVSVATPLAVLNRPPMIHRGWMSPAEGVALCLHARPPCDSLGCFQLADEHPTSSAVCRGRGFPVRREDRSGWRDVGRVRWVDGAGVCSPSG